MYPLTPTEVLYTSRPHSRSFISNNSIPKEVRRRILEASVRAPEAGTPTQSAAFSSGDKDWMLTGRVFDALDCRL